VVDRLIDPRFDEALDVAEIADHAAAVEFAAPDGDLGDRVVPVRMLADPVVVEQTVPVAEIYPLRD